MQRLTKYNLLLCAIRKHFVEDNEAEIMDSMVNKTFWDFSYRLVWEPHWLHGMFSPSSVSICCKAPWNKKKTSLLLKIYISILNQHNFLCFPPSLHPPGAQANSIIFHPLKTSILDRIVLKWSFARVRKRLFSVICLRPRTIWFNIGLHGGVWA